MFMGPEVLREVIENAELYPIKGLFGFKDFFDEINSYYYQRSGYQLGVSTGWKSLNDFYNVSIICGLVLFYFISINYFF